MNKPLVRDPHVLAHFHLTGEGDVTVSETTRRGTIVLTVAVTHGPTASIYIPRRSAPSDLLALVDSFVEDH